ncbi:hypothetical protein MHA_0657 [Mannheimia haemolytica PHL213]|nr:hypothetical protein MHA_0657 [Mannheimia haemolytica PHL213]
MPITLLIVRATIMLIFIFSPVMQIGLILYQIKRDFTP